MIRCCNLSTSCSMSGTFCPALHSWKYGMHPKNVCATEITGRVPRWHAPSSRKLLLLRNSDLVMPKWACACNCHQRSDANDGNPAIHVCQLYPGDTACSVLGASAAAAGSASDSPPPLLCNSVSSSRDRDERTNDDAPPTQSASAAVRGNVRRTTAITRIDTKQRESGLRRRQTLF